MRNSIYLVFQKVNDENLYLIYSAQSMEKAEGFALKYAMKHAVGGKFKNHNQDSQETISSSDSMQTILSFTGERENARSRESQKTQNELSIVSLEIGKRYPLDSEEILRFSA